MVLNHSWNLQHGHTADSHRVSPVLMRIAYSCFTLIILVLNIVAIVAMWRTKRVPFAAKMMSIGLLSFDCIYTVSSTSYLLVAGFRGSPDIATVCSDLVVISTGLSYTTIGLMAVDKLLIVSYPYRYLRQATPLNIAKTLSLIWAVVFVLLTSLIVVKYIFCPPSLLLKCNAVLYIVGIAILSLLTVGCAVIYAILFRRIVHQNTRSMARSPAFGRSPRRRSQYQIRPIKSHSSTTLAFILFLVFVIFSVHIIGKGTVVVLNGSLLHTFQPDVFSFWHQLVICVINPILYVWWFKECRLNIVSLMAPCSRRLRQTELRLKIQVFNIVTVDTNVLAVP